MQQKHEFTYREAQILRTEFRTLKSEYGDLDSMQKGAQIELYLLALDYADGRPFVFKLESPTKTEATSLLEFYGDVWRYVARVYIL